MSRIRSARQASTLRPLAVERVRQGRFKPGDTVFYRGITYAYVRVLMVFPQQKPNRLGVFQGRSMAFVGSFAEVDATEGGGSYGD